MRRRNVLGCLAALLISQSVGGELSFAARRESAGGQRAGYYRTGP